MHSICIEPAPNTALGGQPSQQLGRQARPTTIFTRRADEYISDIYINIAAHRRATAAIARTVLHTCSFWYKFSTVQQNEI